MLGHYALTFYRSLTRRWLYAALNVLGLALGIAVFVVLMLDVAFETSFDRWIPGVANIYRFSSTFTFPGRGPDRIGLTTAAMTPAFRTDFPGAGEITRLVDSERPIANGPMPGSEHMDYVDANFFSVLDLPLAIGDRARALAHPDDVVVTEAIARKYFGATAVLGRALTLYYHGVARTHRISGVLRDLPANTHLKLAVVAPITPAFLSDKDNGLNLWGAPQAFVYARFNDPGQAAAVAAQLPDFVRRRAHDPVGAGGTDVSRVLSLSLTPVTRLHFEDSARRWTMRPGADGRLVYALALVGVLTLLVAVLNYINLATARSALRAREIALRKVMGATRTALIAQLLGEAVIFAFVAVVCGVALAELSLPAVDSLIGGSLKLTYWGAQSVLPWAIALAAAIGLGAGLYPALLLSRFAPAPVLASARTPGGGRGEARVRSLLIGAQFAVAIAFTVCTLVVGSQARFIRESDRGFRREGLILLDNLGAVLIAPRQNQVLNVLRGVPGVVAATAAELEPGMPNEAIACVRRASGGAGGGVSMTSDVVGDDYLKTFGARLAAGRMFDRAHGADDVDGQYKGSGDAGARGIDIVLNETAAHALGFPNAQAAVGQRVFTPDDCAGAPRQSVEIIGVLRDVHFGSPLRPVSAMFYRYDSQAFMSGGIGAVRFAGVSEPEMISRLQAAWRREAPIVPFLAKSADEGLSDYFVPDERRARLFTIGSVLAVGIGCVGLYGLASFNAARRFKEIGIRKTLGASTADILTLLIGQFLRPVLVANLAAWPLAYLAMHAYLAGFDQRIGLNPLYFAAATALTLLIAVATVGGQAYAVARAEPAKALRCE
jgi:putative ABC transport system permease protein